MSAKTRQYKSASHRSLTYIGPDGEKWKEIIIRSYSLAFKFNKNIITKKT